MDTLTLAALEPGVEVRQLAAALDEQSLYVVWTTEQRRNVNSPPQSALWFARAPDRSHPGQVPVELFGSDIDDVAIAIVESSIHVYYCRRDEIVRLRSSDHGAHWTSDVIGRTADRSFARSLATVKADDDVFLVATVAGVAPHARQPSDRLEPGIHVCAAGEPEPRFVTAASLPFLIGEQDKPSVTRGDYGLRIAVMLGLSVSEPTGSPPPGRSPRERLARPLVLEARRYDGKWSDVTPKAMLHGWPARSQVALAERGGAQALVVYSTPSVLGVVHADGDFSVTPLDDIHSWCVFPLADQQLATAPLDDGGLVAWMDYRNQVDEGKTLPLVEQFLMDRRRLNNDLRVALLEGATQRVPAGSIQLTSGTPIVSALAWAVEGGEVRLVAAIRPHTTFEDYINATSCQIIVFGLRATRQE